MIRKLVAAFVMILFAASLHSTAFAAATGYFPVDGDTKRLDDGNFKAGGDIIRVTGMAAPPKNFGSKDSYAKTFARQAARLDALRQLVEVIDGVTSYYDEVIDGVTSYYDESGDKVTTRISQDSKAFKLLEKNARVVGVKFLDDGGCEVTMELVFPTDWKIDIQPFPVPPVPDWKND